MQQSDLSGMAFCEDAGLERFHLFVGLLYIYNMHTIYF